MFRASKILLLSLLVVTMFAAVANATTSRVASLAGAASYINDDSDIFRWYGTLPSYKNMVMAELGQASVAGGVLPGMAVGRQALGFTYSRGEDDRFGTWGIFLLQGDLEDGSFYLFNPLGTILTSIGMKTGPGTAPTGSGSDTSVDLPAGIPTTKFVIAWGKQINNIGLGINFTRSDLAVEDTTTKNLSLTTIGGAVRVDINQDMYLDGAITWGSMGGDTLGGFDKSNSWNLEARLFNEQATDLTIVPFFGWRFWEFSTRNDASPQGAPVPNSRGDKVNDVNFGVSMNWDVNSNNLLVFATELGFFNWKYSNQASGEQRELDQRTIPKFFIALESDINSWLTTRIGATKNMSRTRIVSYDATATGDFVETVYTSTQSLSGSDFDWTLGAGFHIAEWDIDLLVHEETPFRLGYWLTGFGAGVNSTPVTRMSATYRF